jgi:hypothetical protein
VAKPQQLPDHPALAGIPDSPARRWVLALLLHGDRAYSDDHAAQNRAAHDDHADRADPAQERVNAGVKRQK